MSKIKTGKCDGLRYEVGSASCQNYHGGRLYSYSVSTSHGGFGYVDYLEDQFVCVIRFVSGSKRTNGKWQAGIKSIGDIKVISFNGKMKGRRKFRVLLKKLRNDAL